MKDNFWRERRDGKHNLKIRLKFTVNPNRGGHYSQNYAKQGEERLTAKPGIQPFSSQSQSQDRQGYDEAQLKSQGYQLGSVEVFVLFRVDLHPFIITKNAQRRKYRHLYFRYFKALMSRH